MFFKVCHYNSSIVYRKNPNSRFVKMFGEIDLK